MRQLIWHCCVQLVSVADVGQPTRAAAAAADSTKQRILRLRLTDGVTDITCIEVRQVSALSPNLVPGTKLRLSQAPVRAGVVLLKPENVEARNLPLLPSMTSPVI